MATLRGCALGNSSHQRAAGDGEAGDLGRDVDARGGYRIAELHGVVDLYGQQAALRLEQVDGQHAAAHRPCCRQAEFDELVAEGTVAGHAAAGGVGDPMLGAAVDGGDDRVAHYEGADVAPGLVHVLLHVVNLVRRST